MLLSNSYSDRKLSEKTPELKISNESGSGAVGNSSSNLDDIQHISKDDHYNPEIRLINIQKDGENSSGSCGFNLSRSKWDPYPWVSAVDQNSPAFNAGLKVGDCVLEVNGEDVLGLRISEIANLVKVRCNNLSLLLWSTGRDPTCDKNSLCCGPMPLSLERLSASMQTILACLECPVCMDILPAPVAQCQNGHILCIKCRSKSEKCPICRQHYSCVRSLIAEQIYSSIVDAFKLYDNDDDDDDDNDEMNMNNIRSTGRKLREKLFGAKYKKKQQSVLFQTTNIKSTTIQTIKTKTTTEKVKSTSINGINNTSSFDSNLNNDKIILNKDIPEHHGSGNLFSDYSNGILTPTNRFLAKILGKAYSMENLPTTMHCNANALNESNNINNNSNNSKETVISDNIYNSKQNLLNQKFKIEQQQQKLEQQAKKFSSKNYLQPLNCNLKEVKQFSQSTNNLSSSSSSSNYNHHHSQDNNNLMIIAIPRCPSLNPLPTYISSSSSLPSKLLLPLSSTSSTASVSASMLYHQAGSLKGLNNCNNNSSIGHIDNNNDNEYTSSSSCGHLMNKKANSNISLDVNNLHSCNTVGLMLHKRPSSAIALSTGIKREISTSISSLLNDSSKSVENVDLYDKSVNQCSASSMLNMNENKGYHNIDIIISDSGVDTNNVSENKKLKVVKLSDDVGIFLCPLCCSEDKFNVVPLEKHIKLDHLTPIIAFGASTTEIALPLKEPINSAIIELNLNENIFWIKIDVDRNGSILVIAFLQGTDDESTAFMLEGQLRNRVDDKLLEKKLITRSMVYSMMKSSWNSQYNNAKNYNGISKQVLERADMNTSNMVSKKSNIETKNLLNEIEKTNMDNVKMQTIDSNEILDNNIVTTVNNINNIDSLVSSCDDFNPLNCIRNNSNQNNFSLQDNKYNYDIDRQQQLDCVFFHQNSIRSTFNNNNYNNNNCKENELLLEICVKYR